MNAVEARKNGALARALEFSTGFSVHKMGAKVERDGGLSEGPLWVTYGHSGSVGAAHRAPYI
jgi:hypothetical protein